MRERKIVYQKEKINGLLLNPVEKGLWEFHPSASPVVAFTTQNELLSLKGQIHWQIRHIRTLDAKSDVHSCPSPGGTITNVSRQLSIQAPSC